jgi:hypothetical protein
MADIFLDAAHVLKAAGCRHPISSRQSLEGKKPVSEKPTSQDLAYAFRYCVKRQGVTWQTTMQRQCLCRLGARLLIGAKFMGQLDEKSQIPPLFLVHQPPVGTRKKDGHKSVRGEGKTHD